MVKASKAKAKAKGRKGSRAALRMAQGEDLAQGGPRAPAGEDLAQGGLQPDVRGGMNSVSPAGPAPGLGSDTDPPTPELVDSTTLEPRPGFIVDSLIPLTRPIATMVMDPANARMHPERNLEAIKLSLQRFGQRKPIVVRKADHVVMAGNGTLAAARSLGWTTIAAVLVDDDASTAAAFAIADNRSAELAVWDWQALSRTIDGLKSDSYDLDVLGFTDSELDGIMGSTFQPEQAKDDEFGGTGDYTSATIKMTANQYEVVQRAVTALRVRENEPEMTEGRALELMALDFIA